MTSPIGAVLCGGASRRMETDKAMIEVDGIAMARRVADALAGAGCSPVMAIGGNRAALNHIGLDLVADEFPGEGPLGGILTALAVGAPVAVAACDLPELASPTVAALVAALGDHDVAIARSDRAEPLCAVWAGSSAAILRTRFLAGERAVHRAIAGLDIAWVPVSLSELRNVNTPGDLGSL
jgi:molybdopterin-guanine dinucleotide biosynthesis protein A